jgi:hypothetical protein
VTRIIEATIFQGARVATKNLSHQLPELKKQFQEIANIHPGSINVLLGKPLSNPPQIETLHIQKWDCVTTPIQWWDAGPDQYQTEFFGFLRIEFEYPLNGPLTRAWIIDCYNSQAHGQPQFYEIVAERIEGVSYFQPCRIHVPERAL